MIRVRLYIETCFLLLRAVSRFVRSGRATTIPKNPARVAVVQLAKMGDMVCTTPVFRAIHKAFPHAEIIVVGDRVNKELLSHHPDVSSYVLWNNDVQSLAVTLRERRLDAAFLMSPHTHALAALYISGTPLVVAPEVFGGWSPMQTYVYRFLLRLVTRSTHHFGAYAPREYLRTLEPLGIISNDTTKTLAYSKFASEKVEVFMKQHSLVPKQFTIISPSAGNKIKCWPPERFAEVAIHLATNSMPVAIIGGPRDKEEVAAVFAHIQDTTLSIVRAEHFSVDELKAFISYAKLFVSTDTGPLYIAEAYGVPTIDIVGPMDEREQPPQGSRHVVIVPKRTAPVLHIMNARVYDETEALRQARATTAHEVIKAIQTLVASL